MSNLRPPNIWTQEADDPALFKAQYRGFVIYKEESCYDKFHQYFVLWDDENIIAGDRTYFNSLRQLKKFLDRQLQKY